MHVARPPFALDPKRFGRGRLRDLGPAPRTSNVIGDDLKLFATTFAAGFVLVSILIG